MEQHAIPRQITSFEFKLIGFLTLKQFIYVVVFSALGYVTYMIVPIPFINILFGVLVGGIGLALAFLPINDRPLEVWIKNIIKRLTSPTQYFFLKQNPPVSFLNNLYFLSDPHQITSHIESQEKLASYLSKTSSTRPSAVNNKNSINSLLQKPSDALRPKASSVVSQPVAIPQSSTTPVPNESLSPAVPVPGPKTAFLTGIVKNHKLIPLPGILVYVKDQNGKTLRLLKSNPHGVFATFNPLIGGEYTFEAKDPNGNYFFDTMKISVENQNLKPIEIFSKELL
ncbi:PrgI family protein [Candidatus Roizmanbacteria bacterium]|nr:PrgI family protein [Candidatus Roizmanbacteria bacterium]